MLKCSSLFVLLMISTVSCFFRDRLYDGEDSKLNRLRSSPIPSPFRPPFCPDICGEGIEASESTVVDSHNKMMQSSKIDENDDGGDNQARIVGGWSAKYSRPWLVLIRAYNTNGDPEDYESCGGAIINKRFILTAAHCVCMSKSPIIKCSKGQLKYEPREVLKVFIGVNTLDLEQALNRNNVKYHERTVKEVIVHPDWSGESLSVPDLALILLESDIQFTTSNSDRMNVMEKENDVWPICLPTPDMVENFKEDFGNIVRTRSSMPLHSSSSYGYVAGWGLTSNDACLSNDHGPDKHTRCHFPFSYRGRNRESCQKTKSPSSNNLQCVKLKELMGDSVLPSDPSESVMILYDPKEFTDYVRATNSQMKRQQQIMNNRGMARSGFKRRMMFEPRSNRQPATMTYYNTNNERYRNRRSVSTSLEDSNEEEFNLNGIEIEEMNGFDFNEKEEDNIGEQKGEEVMKNERDNKTDVVESNDSTENNFRMFSHRYRMPHDIIRLSSTSNRVMMRNDLNNTLFQRRPSQEQNFQKTICYHEEPGEHGWCGTCRKSARKGERGYCPPGGRSHSNFRHDQITIVRPSMNWGFCSDTCRYKWGQEARRLQETRLSILPNDVCKLFDSKSLKYQNGHTGYVEFCAGHKIAFPRMRVFKFQYQNGIPTYTESKPKINTLRTKKEQWRLGYYIGKSDSCQGDSGGPFYSFGANIRANDDKAYCLGVVSRGQECGGFNKPGIYSNLLHKEFTEWIVSNAKFGNC